MNRIAVVNRLSLASTSPTPAGVDARPVTPTDALLADATPVLGAGFLLAWVTIGLLTALVVRRRGHHFPSAAALGFVFGPLFIPLAVLRVREGEENVQPVVVEPGESGAGPVDVLIGLDGATSSAASVMPVLVVLERQLGRLTLARVLDFESIGDEEERKRAALALSCASLFLGNHHPSLVLVPGYGQRALVEHACAAGYNLVVIVTRSRRVLTTVRRRGGDPSIDFPVLLVADTAPPER